MITYSRKPERHISNGSLTIPSFIIQSKNSNKDEITIASFGNEWEKFNSFTDDEINQIASEYFDIVDSKFLQKNCVALDVGCGSGRWTRFLASRVGFVESVDPSNAVFVAKKINEPFTNVRISHAEVDDLPFNDEQFDFVFSLGVLHHIPDTESAMRKCVSKLKQGGCFLVYLYYSLENKSLFYKIIFHISNSIRFIVSKMPTRIKEIICDIIAVLIYFPLAKFSLVIIKLKWTKLFNSMPLHYYFDKSFLVMRNDALDRFGTPLEQRFSKKQIHAMMERCGLTEIRFSDNEPYWHATGIKK